MADGSIVFDTELNPEGLNKGLQKLGDDSSTGLKELSDTVNRRLAEAFGTAAAEVKTQTKSITDEAIAAEKQYDNESERVQNNRKNAEAAYIQYIRDNLDKIRGIREDELKCLELSYELGIISTEEYFSRLQDFRDRYFLRGSADWLKYTGEVLEHNKKLAEEQEKALTKAAEETADNINDIFEELEKNREKLSEKISSYGGISNQHKITGDGLDIEYVSLANIGKQNEQLEEYLRLMTIARDRINSYWRDDTGNTEIDEKNRELRNSYFSQIRDMSIEDATDFARTISGTSDENFFSHLRAFEEREKLADEISKTLYSSEVKEAAEDAAKKLGSNFTSALSEEFESLSGKFFSNGQSACESFGEGFMSSLNSVLDELSRSISAGVSSLGYGNIFSGGVSNIENNTSYNIYNPQSPDETIRLMREKDEMKKMMLE
ncbi:MAG: hypothetical protein UIM24_05465 [Clostridia bacterium]|nr:hypothetical protein [Clostridia bacterium]